MEDKAVEKKAKRVSDIIGDGKVTFHPDYPKVDIETIIDADVMLLDVQIMRGWKSSFNDGVSDWALIAFQDVKTGDKYTTKCGGQVLVKRLIELQARRAFPLVGSIVMQGDSERPYYNVI